MTKNATCPSSPPGGVRLRDRPAGFDRFPKARVGFKRPGDVAGSVGRVALSGSRLKNNHNSLQARAPAAAVGPDAGCSADALLTPEQLSARAKITLV